MDDSRAVTAEVLECLRGRSFEGDKLTLHAFAFTHLVNLFRGQITKHRDWSMGTVEPSALFRDELLEGRRMAETTVAQVRKVFVALNNSSHIGEAGYPAITFLDFKTMLSEADALFASEKTAGSFNKKGLAETLLLVEQVQERLSRPAAPLRKGPLPAPKA